MYRETEEYGRGLSFLGFPGKFLMAGKIRFIPGTGSAGNPLFLPFRFCFRNVLQQIRQVAMSIGSHDGEPLL
jgi:hypothetical protein